jgi:acetyl esterase/lipase
VDRVVVPVLLVALAAVTLAAVPAPGRSGIPCTGSPHQARPITIQVEGEDATGLFAVPKTAPRGLVVFAHGYGHTSESWREHLTRTAEQDGVVAVAMDYRGTEILPPDERGALPSSRGWQVTEGAEDSIAVAQLFERRCPTIDDLVVYGVSMGGNTSGLAAAAGAERSDGRPLFDHWVAIEGASNVIETYKAARLLAGTGNGFAANAVEDIERQMGGTFEEVPDAFLERTVVTRADDIATSGIRGVVLVHGVDDGLVPINQSREMAAALQAAGVPVEMHTVLTREPGTEAGMTATGTVLGATGYESPLAGHASEASTTHTVGMAGFALLSELFDGARVGCGEFLIDGMTGIRQGSSVPC